ncbi:MAG: TIGR01777 family oxidoreductase [Myxococcaceae bacterium]|nr:TIGR01777 family oxidoreductase [Myxococcaceae bacterium]
MGKRVIISGATGRLGQALARSLIERGDSLVVLTRDTAAAEERLPGAAQYLPWNGITIGPWVDTFDGADAVVNLTGASLFGEGMRGRRAWEQLARTRLLATRVVVEGLESVRRRPGVFVNASGVELYGFTGVSDTPVDEHTEPGRDAYARGAREWEQAANEARTVEVRTALVRLGFVLDANSGGLPLLVRQYALRIGGPALPLRAWRPWIHIADAAALFLLAIDDERVNGPLNATAPEPRTNEDFAQLLSKMLERPAWLPTPGFVLERFVGTPAAASLSRGKRVLPGKAEELGYRFRFRRLEDALDDVLTPRRDSLLTSGPLHPEPI